MDKIDPLFPRFVHYNETESKLWFEEIEMDADTNPTCVTMAGLTNHGNERSNELNNNKTRVFVTVLTKVTSYCKLN